MQGLGGRANDSRNYAQVTVAHMSPHFVTVRLRHSLGGIGLQASAHWADARPISANATRYQRQRRNLAVSGAYRITPRVSAFFALRNVRNDPSIRVEPIGANPAGAQFFQKFGVITTLGVRTTF